MTNTSKDTSGRESRTDDELVEVADKIVSLLEEYEMSLRDGCTAVLYSLVHNVRTNDIMQGLADAEALMKRRDSIHSMDPEYKLVEMLNQLFSTYAGERDDLN